MATTNPSPSTSAPPLAGSTGGVRAASSSTGSLPPAGPTKYAVTKPARIRITVANLARQIGRSAKSFLHLLWNVLGHFEPMPNARAPLTLAEPAGHISTEMLAVCEHLSADAEARLTKLETKSTGLLSLIAIVIPLTASAAVFVRQHTLPPVAAISTLTLNLIAMIFFVLGLFAALRALAVRGQETLFLNAVIDPVTDRVRDYSANFFGRGLLYIAATRQAICDHIADFVRAAQVFLVLGVMLAAAAAGIVLFHVHEDTQSIEGTVGLDAPTLTALQSSVDSVNQSSAARFARIESELDTLRRGQVDSLTAARLDRLTQQVDELRKELAERRPAKPDSSRHH